jgi:hypothetical protein
MDPTLQVETNQKLNTDFTSFHSQVNKDILSIHAKMNYIQEQLGSQMTEVNSAPQKFMNKFQGPSSDPPLYPEDVGSKWPLHSHSNSLPRDPRLPVVEVKKFDGSNPTT